MLPHSPPTLRDPLLLGNLLVLLIFLASVAWQFFSFAGIGGAPWVVVLPILVIIAISATVYGLLFQKSWGLPQLFWCNLLLAFLLVGLPLSQLLALSWQQGWEAAWYWHSPVDFLIRLMLGIFFVAAALQVRRQSRATS